MLSQEAMEKILGMNERVFMEPEEMARRLSITFFPFEKNAASAEVLAFREELENSFRRVGVNVVPYEEATVLIPYRKVFLRIAKIVANNVLYVAESLFRKPQRIYVNSGVIKNTFRRLRIKKGISIVATGEYETDNLPMGHASSFTESSVISILDLPKNITTESSFHEHFDTAMGLFSYHMTNIVLAVASDKWIVYNFNASHPVYRRNISESEFDKKIRYALIPKIYAPIRPHKFSEFIVQKNGFDPYDDMHKSAVRDMIESGNILERTGLYPAGKKIDDLPFRNGYYRWIGKIHLDNRNGMSYGFLARQLPTKLSSLMKEEEAKKIFPNIPEDKDYFYNDGELYVILDLRGVRYVLKIPEVWVLSLRSGCDKTKPNPGTDFVKLGLSAGKMYLQGPRGFRLDANFKTSFDTKVILAHAVGNAIAASISQYFQTNKTFTKTVRKRGVSISHWHGYINAAVVPNGYFVHGQNNPHVACSSPQSAVYALEGKLKTFARSLAEGKEYRGDVHIEPHHGTNIIFSSLKDFGDFIINTPDSSTLGNKYLFTYNSY